MLVDTHCHLGDPAFDGDRDDVLRRAVAAGVPHLIIVGDSLDGTVRAVRLANAHGLSATAGVHPHVATTWTAEVAARIEEALRDQAVVALGETGLDYHYDHSPRDHQRRAFEDQLQMAARVGKPVVIHAREADDDMVAILKAYGPSLPALVLHSFSSGTSVFEAGLEVAAYFSFSGMVTFNNWRLGPLVQACPAESLLLETDAPYLAPVPHRGRRNEPAFVVHVADRVAHLRGVSRDVIAAQSTDNAVRCFGNRVRPSSQPVRS